MNEIKKLPKFTYKTYPVYFVSTVLKLSINCRANPVALVCNGVLNLINSNWLDCFSKVSCDL